MRDDPVPERAPLRARWMVGRQWLVGGSIAVLALLVVFLGMWVVRSENQIEQLRAELHGIYAEAESLRTGSVQAQQRAVLLDQQVHQLRTERETLLRKLSRQDAAPKVQSRPNPRTRRGEAPARSKSAPALPSAVSRRPFDSIR